MLHYSSEISEKQKCHHQIKNSNAYFHSIKYPAIIEIVLIIGLVFSISSFETESIQGPGRAF